jgi:hypothetical protein
MSTVNIIISFVLISLVGNYLLSAYQYRAWVRQRRFEKKAESIQYLYDLFAELTSLMSKRRYAMLKLVYALRKNDKDRINNARIEYKKYLDEWNTKLNAFLIKVVFHLDEDEMMYLEDHINADFVAIGQEIELCLRDARNATNSRLASIENKLNSLNRDIINIIRDIYRKIHKIEKQEIFTEDILLRTNEYSEAHTLVLFRNLFRTRV